MSSLKEMIEQAKSARADNNYDKAIALYQDACRRYPKSIAAEHNLAALLGDLNRFSESLAHAENALQKGGDASATWLVYARALMGLQQYDEAIQAYRKAVYIDPLSYDAHREYAQLLWMKTKDLGTSLALIDNVLSNKENLSLGLLKAQIFEYAEELAQSQGLLIKLSDKWPVLAVLQALSHVSMRIGDSATAICSIKRSIDLSPDNFSVRVTASYIYASVGDAETALLHACEAERMRPRNQEALACKATALRLLYQKTENEEYNENYQDLYNYDKFVAKIPVDVPEGWKSREAFFSDLAQELKRIHPFKTHPFGQSVRGGSQLPDILSLNNPLINIFRKSIQEPVNRYLKTLGNNTEHPLTKYNTGRWKCSGIWSVWLHPGGYHENHIHPEGWLSSACYIELPDDIDDEDGKLGWLKLGQPMFPTQPQLGVEHWVKPEVGHLALFPSYMWHGTSLFTGNKPRLSIALDIVPDT